jgi:nitrite reductase/ring-hydroxylating ferredoxin subunit
LALKIERHRIAIFLHDGQLRAISDICNHRGGPLSEGRLHGEFVMCPWHAWEYSVVTGKGPVHVVVASGKPEVMKPLTLRGWRIVRFEAGERFDLRRLPAGKALEVVEGRLTENAYEPPSR